MTERFPSKDEVVAYSVVQRLDDFVVTFQNRTTSSGALEAILEDDKEFLGGIVEQKPEFFTEKHLIVPVLEALGYEDIRWRPHDLIKEETNQPDFKINGGPPEMVCIVEGKKLGRERDEWAADRRIRRYLQQDTFVKYATDREREYLVAIGTDGVDWTLRGKEVGRNESRELAIGSLREALLELAQVRRRETPPPDRLMHDLRSGLAGDFTPGLAKHRLQEHLQEEFEQRP